MKNITFTKSVLAVLGLCLVAQSSAYSPVEQTWPSAAATFYTGDLDSPWQGAFTEAAARWDDTSVNITIDLTPGGTEMSCDLDDRNGAWWADEECDGEWSDSTLAITYYWFTRNNELVEADILFNNTVNWSIYDSAEQSSLDFRRVAVHEIGHAYGAGHSKASGAIMRAFIDDIIVPAQDDIDALAIGGAYGIDRYYNLNLDIRGNGKIRVRPRVPGTITGPSTDPSALDCDSDCTRSLQNGLRLDIFAVANNGESFVRWEGLSGCTSLPGCQLEALTGNRTITAIFSGDNGSASPAKPGNVSATDKSLKNKIKITWSGSDIASHYKVRRKKSGGSYSTIAQTNIATYVDKTVQPLLQYLYQIKACNDTDCSAWSSKDGGKAAFDKPGNVSASKGEFTNKVKISWSKVANAKRYQTHRATSKSGKYSKIGQSSKVNLTDKSVTSGQRYYYKVRACNDYGCGGFSSIQSGYSS